MGNAAAMATLGRHVAALNALADGEEFVTLAAAEAADAIEKQLKSDLDSGLDAYGMTMAKRQVDGKPAMVGAFDKYVRVDPVGNVVLLRLRGKVPVLHHHGDGRGKDIKRRLIPVSTIPVHWLPLIRKSTIKTMQGVLNG